jgi:hypothetical protein
MWCGGTFPLLLREHLLDFSVICCNIISCSRNNYKHNPDSEKEVSIEPVLRFLCVKTLRGKALFA